MAVFFFTMIGVTIVKAPCSDPLSSKSIDCSDVHGFYKLSIGLTSIDRRVRLYDLFLLYNDDDDLALS